MGCGWRLEVNDLNTGALKRFTVTVLKIGCGIVFATLIVSFAVWGVLTVRENSEEAANAPLATLKNWPETAAISNAMCRLRTVWRTGTVYYQFEVEGYPPVVINFLDKDGFKLFQHGLPLSEMAQVIGPDGQPSGLLWKGDESMNADLYRRAASWEISWSGFSPAPALEPATPSARSIPPPKPASPVAPKWRNVSLWRGLRHGMSRDEVKKILGEPGKIDDLGFQVTWNYGYPFGGSVTFGRDGTVESWSEP
jgi:hypothetical protein